MDRADLHIHTSASDGTFPPYEIVRLAARSRLRAIAVTDHDTTDAAAPAAEAGYKYGVEVIPGIEISAGYRSGEIHILGYFIDPLSQSLAPATSWSINERSSRNAKIISALSSSGFEITQQELSHEFPDTVIGRPHIARLLMKKGYVSSIKEAFDRFLAEGRPYYVPRSFIPAQQAVNAIHGAGGLAVLAHPGIYNYSPGELSELISYLYTCGLNGIEAIYTEHSPQLTDSLIRLANDFSLAVTGGSDFHGSNKPDIQIGTGRGNLNIEYKIVEKLRSML